MAASLVRLSMRCVATMAPTAMAAANSSSFQTSRPVPRMPSSQLPSPRSKGTLIGAIDQGTTSTRFVLVDDELREVAKHGVAVAQSHPRAGWVEMDPFDILKSVHECMAGCMEQLEASSYNFSRQDVAAVGLTNQRETTVVWDRRTGEPLHPAIVWLDTRTQGTSQQIIQELGGSSDALREACGLPISSYFSGVKLRWLVDNVPAVRDGLANGTALVGNVDAWLIWNLTGGPNGGNHVTDVTNASRTMLLGIDSCHWSTSLVEQLGLNVGGSAAADTLALLPRVCSSAELLGSITGGTPLDGVPLTGVLGDQMAALVGQRCLSKGELKTTYGTGAFMLVNTGERPVSSSHGLLTTVAYQLGPDADVHYALEGAVAVCGAGIDWMCNTFGFESGAALSAAAQEAPPGNDGVCFVPAFSGLLAPHWREDARGLVVGMTHSTTRAHFARAMLEGIALQVNDVADAMVADMGANAIATLRVDGGVARSSPFLQIQADVMDASVESPANLETTALGAAVAAGLGAGVWASLDDLPRSPIAATYTPDLPPEQRQLLLTRWHRAVDRSLGWLE
eukprot:m.496563 g.496563  ORF g.496563 m.496563 type:complete len:566 (+) comp48089_c0_seq1:55-1752(+)